MAWSTLALSTLLPGKPWTSAKALAVYENALALAEQSTVAPILSTGWHPYNSTAVGDGNSGKFYDFAVDGAASTFDTPMLTDGYDYGILVEGLSLSGGTHPVSVFGYLETSASWVDIGVTSAFAAPDSAYGFVEVAGTRISQHGWRANWSRPLIDSVGTLLAAGFTAPASGIGGSTTQQKLSALRISLPTTNDAGKLYLYRRRNIVGEY